MFADFPESGQAGKIDPAAVGLAGIVTAGVTGLSNSALAWADAFCATETCKLRRKEIEASKENAKASVDAAKYQALGNALAAKSSSRNALVFGLIGAAALGLGVYAYTRRR